MHVFVYRKNKITWEDNLDGLIFPMFHQVITMIYKFVWNHREQSKNVHIKKWRKEVSTLHTIIYNLYKKLLRGVST